MQSHGKAQSAARDDIASANPILDMIAEVHAQCPVSDEENARFPRDGARNYRHYLYGHLPDPDTDPAMHGGPEHHSWPDLCPLLQQGSDQTQWSTQHE